MMFTDIKPPRTENKRGETMLTLDAFEEAAAKVKEVTQETKLIESPYFSEISRNRVFFKPENMQRTGAYKVRGAYYKISTLTDEERAHGLITASAGNHAQGVAYAAQHYGVKATIVMPTTTPLIKVERTKALGADVVLAGNVYDEAYEHALKLAEENSYTFIHPFNDLGVATGQGTIAMEIVQELPLVDYILVPIGGGGLATGVSTLAKLLNPHIKVIGVEPSGAACMKASLEAGHVVKLPRANTIADGTAVLEPGDKIFPYIQENLDGIITGGNMDVITMSSVVQHGLIQRDRIFTVSVLLPDRPGELVRVAQVIADNKGNVIRLDHNQFVTTNRQAAVELRVTIEAFGTDHKQQIVKALEGEGFRPKLINAHL